MNSIRLLVLLIAITVLSFFCVDTAAARYDPYLSDPNTTFFGRLIILNDELNTAGGEERSVQQTSLLEALLQPFDLRGSRPTPTNRVSLQPSNLPTASGGGRNMSRDGLCAVGYQDSGFFTPFHALRWTQATGPIDLGTLGGSTAQSFATDTNQNCSVVVGYSQTAGGAGHAFRWVSPGPIEDLNVLAGASGSSRALGVSSNGSVIVGEAEFPAGAFTRKGAFRWAGGAFTDLIPGLNPSIATAVSADGTVVVGQVGTSTTSQAFRWKQSEPTVMMSPLGTPPTADSTAAAVGVSDNGKVVVGISNPTFLSYQDAVTGWNPGTAFRWAESGPNAGVKDLRELLVANGTDLTGITLISVTGISPDGQWIQGRATTSQTGPNEAVAFIAQFCDENIVGGLAACATTTAPFTLGSSAPNNALTVSAGQSATTTITVTPNAGFAQPVSFACGNLPVGAACAFNPPTVTPNGGPATTTLTLSTDGGPVAFLSPASSVMVVALMPFGLLPAVVLLRRGRAVRRFLSIVGSCSMALALAGILSCNGSESSPPASNSGGATATGTPAGTSTVSVTATSQSASSNLPVTVTVTRP